MTQGRQAACRKAISNPSLEAAAHLVKLAQQPGWWEYVKARARELDRDESRLFVDIEQQVVQQLQALAWRPPPRA